MKIIHLNLSSGISGDMLLAALIDASAGKLDLAGKLSPLSRLGVPAPHIRVRRVENKHLPAAAAEVPGDFRFASPAHIKNIVKKFPAPPSAKKLALAALDNLVSAEAAAHRIPRGKVHFHEMNSKDTLVDILGSALALEHFGPVKIIASPVNVGRANPAALRILDRARAPIYSDCATHELATPTGAAILASLAPDFAPLPAVELNSFGFGAGSADIHGRDNILRVLVGETETHYPSAGHPGPIILMETNIDDMNPEKYPLVQRRLFDEGALDVWLEQIIMKHGRPAVKLCALARPAAVEKLALAILENTTSAGVRFTDYSRISLPRAQTAFAKKFRLPDGKTRSKSERRHRRR